MLDWRRCPGIGGTGLGLKWTGFELMAVEEALFSECMAQAEVQKWASARRDQGL